MVVIGVPIEATSDAGDTPAIAYTGCPVKHGRGGSKPVIVAIESGLCDHKGTKRESGIWQIERSNSTWREFGVNKNF
jgi:hypothetical protein